MIVGLAFAAFAGGTCEAIKLSDITAIAAPAVIVLGERHGTRPDLPRAMRVARRLQNRAPVAIAIEAVHEKYQGVLDQYAATPFPDEEFPAKLDWENSWGFPWRPYAPLVTAADEGILVIAAGTDLGPPPADAPKFQVPPGYLPILADTMGGHEVPPELQDRFARSMAWRDFKIADSALASWDKKGYLVIVTGRGHVEGGKGVAWQADQKTDSPVHAFVLSWTEPPCYKGDKVWR